MPVPPQSSICEQVEGREMGARSATAPGASLAPGDLEELARWIPKKEMRLLMELCERAQRDPDLARPALLLCSAYAKRVARMLDQDPFPTVTRQIAERLRHLRTKGGL
jgi:hypothetical protein